MATQYGRLQEFQPDSDSIKSYLERASLYLKANGITDNKRVPILLSSIGASTYTLLSDLVSPTAPGEKSFDDLCAALRNHFEPRRSTIAERFHFHKRDQAAGESIAEFDAALRCLSIHCQFGETLEDSLRDRFVCGLRHEPIQRCLLAETSLTYSKALDIARGMESAEKETNAFKTTEPAIKKLGAKPQRSSTTQNCYRCGCSNHRADTCKFKDAKCHACGKTGHIAPACRSKMFKPKKGQIHSKVKKTYRISDGPQSDEVDSSDGEFKIYNIGKQSADPIVVPLTLNGKTLNMEVDTGAALSVVSEATRLTHFPKETLRPSNLILKTYTDERLTVKGTLNMHVQYGEQKQKLVLVVVSGNGPSLIGRNWLKYIRLD